MLANLDEDTYMVILKSTSPHTDQPSDAGMSSRVVGLTVGVVAFVVITAAILVWAVKADNSPVWVANLLHY